MKLSEGDLNQCVPTVASLNVLVKNLDKNICTVDYCLCLPIPLVKLLADSNMMLNT